MELPGEILKKRQKILLWIHSCVVALEFSDEAYFYFVEIYDRVLYAKAFNLSDEALTLYGISSLLIAMKYCEVNQLTPNFFQKKIGHKKYSLELILSAELKIMKLLKFKIPTPTFNEIVTFYFSKIFGNQINSCVYARTLFSFTVMHFKLTTLDLGMSHYIKKSTLYSAILYYSAVHFGKYLRGNSEKAIRGINSYLKDEKVNPKSVMKITKMLNSNFCSNDSAQEMSDYITKLFLSPNGTN